MDKFDVYNEMNREWQDVLLLHSRVGDAIPDQHALRAASMAVSPAVLFAELEDSRTSWNHLLNIIRAEENADMLVTRLWTLKDMMAHLASWACEFRRQVEMAVKGSEFDYAIPYALSAEGPNEWNQAEVEKRRSASVAWIKREFNSETKKLQYRILSLPDELIEVEMSFPMSPGGDLGELWKGNIGQIVGMKCLHERWHIDRLKQWYSSLNEGR